MRTDADTNFKGYTIRHIKNETLINGIGTPMLVKVYTVYDEYGRVLAKAWGMKEAKALVNADIRGEL